jgi:YqjK-like protein
VKNIRSQLADIVRRKERLVVLADAQRAVLAGCVAELRGPAGVADRGLEVVRFLRGHPIVVGSVLAAIMVFRGRSLLSLVGRGLAAWRVWRSLVT